MFNHSNKTALVTGASRGIGKEIASILAENGIKVIGVATSEKSLESISNIDNIIPLACDISDEQSVEKIYTSIKEHSESIDILVNNAGIHMDNILLRMDTKEWKKVLDVNLNGPFYLTRLLLKDMIKNKQGRIVNISSISGTDGNKGQSNYSASKGGLLAFTKSLAKEVGRRNITVNCIAPGIIETDMIADLSDTVKTDYLKKIPLKKFGKPEDIGKMILFLCSDEASYITGQTFYIDGGMSLNYFSSYIMSSADKVKNIIVDKLGVEESRIVPEASFLDDLGADSLDLVELIMEFEEEFDLEIPDEDAEGITTVGSAIDYINKHTS